MARHPFNYTVYTTLNGSGNGSVKVGPLSAREVWYPDNVAVSANSNPINDATCTISVGDVNTKSFRDSTFTGSSGDSTDRCNADQIRVGSYVWADWTGGDPGNVAKMTVTGTREL